MAKSNARSKQQPKKDASEQNGFGLPVSPAEMAVPISPAELGDGQNVEVAAIGYVTIKLPVILDDRLAKKMLSGYASRNIDFNGSNSNACSVKMLWCALSEAHERYQGGQGSRHPDGRVVEAPSHGVRWLLDEYAREVEKLTGKTLLTDYEMQF